MIVGPDFVWLHFPKCGGTSVESALRKLYDGRNDVAFDNLKDYSRPIWHQNIKDRQKLDPSLVVAGKKVPFLRPRKKKVLSCIRRLPHWMLSRIHFEVSRPPHHVASREMIEQGKFFEQGGTVGSAETYARYYSDVDQWLRVEHLAEDLADALGLDRETAKDTLKKVNETTLPYVKGVSFWFTQRQIDALYEACPTWATIEKKVYGSLFSV